MHSPVSPRSRFLLRHTPCFLEDSPQPGRVAGRGRRRRPERQQILLRRGLALGGGLLLLILIVLGVKGCLNARKDRALSDYARNVTQIVEETDQTSKTFFAKLDDPGEPLGDRIRRPGQRRPQRDGQLRQPHRRPRHARRHGPRPERARADLRAARQRDERNRRKDEHRARRRRLRESDGEASPSRCGSCWRATSLYAAVVRPEINGVLAANGIEGIDVPKSIFLARRDPWLDESEVSAALGSVSGASSGAATSGVHGLGLIGTSINGTELTRRIDHLGRHRRHPRSRSGGRRTRANRPRTGSTSRSPSAAAPPSRGRSTASAPAKPRPS